MSIAPDLNSETARLQMLQQARESQALLDEIGMSGLEESPRSSSGGGKAQKAAPAERKVREPRPSLSLGVASASMFDDSLRESVRRISVRATGSVAAIDMTKQLARIQAEVAKGALAEEEDAGERPTGAALPLSVLLGRSDGTGRPLAGLMQNPHTPRELILAALTSPSWSGVSPLMAVQDFTGWEVPEYHQLVTTILCTYRAYTTASKLFDHLSSMYNLLGGCSLSQGPELALMSERILCAAPPPERTPSRRPKRLKNFG